MDPLNPTPYIPIDDDASDVHRNLPMVRFPPPTFNKAFVNLECTNSMMHILRNNPEVYYKEDHANTVRCPILSPRGRNEKYHAMVLSQKGYDNADDPADIMRRAWMAYCPRTYRLVRPFRFSPKKAFQEICDHESDSGSNMGSYVMIPIHCEFQTDRVRGTTFTYFPFDLEKTWAENVKNIADGERGLIDDMFYVNYINPEDSLDLKVLSQDKHIHSTQIVQEFLTNAERKGLSIDRERIACYLDQIIQEHVRVGQVEMYPSKIVSINARHTYQGFVDKLNKVTPEKRTFDRLLVIPKTALEEWTSTYIEPGKASQDPDMCRTVTYLRMLSDVGERFILRTGRATCEEEKGILHTVRNMYESQINNLLNNTVKFFPFGTQTTHRSGSTLPYATMDLDTIVSRARVSVQTKGDAMSSMLGLNPRQVMDGGDGLCLGREMMFVSQSLKKGMREDSPRLFDSLAATLDCMLYVMSRFEQSDSGGINLLNDFEHHVKIAYPPVTRRMDFATANAAGIIPIEVEDRAVTFLPTFIADHPMSTISSQNTLMGVGHTRDKHNATVTADSKGFITAVESQLESLDYFSRAMSPMQSQIMTLAILLDSWIRTTFTKDGILSGLSEEPTPVAGIFIAGDYSFRISLPINDELTIHIRDCLVIASHSRGQYILSSHNFRIVRQGTTGATIESTFD